MSGRVDVHHHLVPPDYAALLRDKASSAQAPAQLPRLKQRLAS